VKSLVDNRVFILALHLKSESLSITEDSLLEMRRLAEALDFVVYGEEIQTRAKPDPKTYMGSGKLLEIKEIVQKQKIELVLLDHDLSPNQGKAIEKILGCMVWDRTQLILEIFAGHAKTPEARNQVELAQLKYMLPRLVGLWAHLDREKGGISASRGTGEKQINIDRTLIRRRISIVEKLLHKMEIERDTQSKKRTQCFRVGIVGYTNAGKTTIMNRLTGSELKEENKLFATLDSTTRTLKGNNNPTIIISDTVGFIQNLPHHLVASFRSTLRVVVEADLLIHVVDSSSPNVEQQIKTTVDVLNDLGAGDIPEMMVFNKSDCLSDNIEKMILKKTWPEGIFVSAFNKENMETLQELIRDFFYSTFVRDITRIDYEQSSLISRFYKLGIVEKLQYKEDGIYVSHATTEANSKKLSSSIEERIEH